MFTKFTSLISFIKLQERYIKFVNNVRTTILDEIKINFADPEKL